MNNLCLESWFPTLIGYAFNPTHDQIQEQLTNHCKGLQTKVSSGGEYWLSNQTYNTSDGHHDCFDDQTFTDLNTWVESQVNCYIEQLKIRKPVVPHSSWFNIYTQGNFQEFHVHPGVNISAIYFLSCTEQCARVIFKTPKNNMFMLEHDELNKATSGNCYYTAQPGKLLIFTSDTEHGVEVQNTDHERITISYNFIQERN